MIKSLDLTKNANNLFISVKDRKNQPSSLSAAGHAILCTNNSNFFIFTIKTI